MPSKVTIIIIVFMFLGLNIFRALLRAHFSPRLAARAKMSLSRAQNIFMPFQHKLYCYSKRTLNRSREAAKPVGAMGLVIAN